MRKARFSALGRRSGASARLTLPVLLAFDFRSPSDEETQGVCVERARALAVAVPLLAVCRGLWSAVLCYSLWRAEAPSFPFSVAALLGVVLALDGGLCAALKRLRPGPQTQARLLVVHALVTGALWTGAAALIAASPASGSVAVRAALVAGSGASLPLFFLAPALTVLSCATVWATGALTGVDPALLGIGAAIALVLTWLSVFRARDQVLSACRRILLEAEAEKAKRFVADYEATGRGWFWESDPEGLLTYVSDALAAKLGMAREAMIGRRFEDLLFAEQAGNPLGFHLSARFPFADVVLRAPGEEEVWWSLSGNPNFDAYGRFQGFRGLGANLTERQRSEAEAKKLARFDSLTGLPNRAAMRAMLDDALGNAGERRRGCALMMIDLDRFKQVNDSLGHPVGDKLLKKVASRLGAVLGDRGRVGRLGGDEFEAILPGIDGEGPLGDLARAIVAEISRPYVIDGHRIEIGTSVGIAVARPGKAYAAGLVGEADLALYAAKADGRGTYRFFVPEMRREAADRQVLEADLRGALAKGQLHLLYQPIVDTVSEEVVAFEALLRWRHPTRGVLMPATVIPLAEETGLMPRIGDWVLRTACAEAAKWPAHIRVAVNLSPAQFADPALPATVTGTLGHVGLDPDRLELEVSERIFLADGGTTDERLARLKRIGVRLALDNYGTGQSALGQLRGAPLDKIKIDRSFVQGAAGPGSRHAAIVRAIVVLAESLGMDTTAEGAETLAEVGLIRRLGCSQVQGFLFGKPMPAADALALARESRVSAEVIGFSRPPRHRLIRNGRLLWDGGGLEVRLRNISEGGAMVECDASLPAGAPVCLDLDEAGRIEGQVRWCQRGQVGLMFAEPFNLAWLSRTRRVRPSTPQGLMPQYLSGAPAPAAEPPSSSPLAKKRRAGQG